MTGHTVTLASAFNRQRAHMLIEKAPAGYVVRIDEPKRTDDQNRKLWAMLSDVSIAKPLGRKHTPDVWKMLMMQACGHECQFEQGLDGRPFPVGFRSSKMTKAQMGELLAFIDAWGTQHGVRWTDAQQVAA